MKNSDITTIDDIKNMVDSFYIEVREDGLIGPVFNEKIGDRWPTHLAKMYTFWETVLLGNHTYFGSPFPSHAQLPVEKKHFDRWLMLFERTVDALFSGTKADEAKWRAGEMAEMFQFKIDHLRKRGKDVIQ
ncbi:MAG: group III truncated hemoglobin [Flavobacteriales bacterium]|nr:group III truncated hemoglobin [Flavobacteriales bacterium]